MKSPSVQQLNNQIRRAASAMTPDCAQELWQKPVEKADSSAWFLEGTAIKEGNEKNAQKKRLLMGLRWAGFAAALFILITVGSLHFFCWPDAVIYLDVNPSLTVEINRFGRVAEVRADNEDGKVILDDMNLINTDVDVCMNALLGSMVRHGYLTQAQNTLLISVNGKDEDRTAVLQQRVTRHAGQTMEALLGRGIIIGQTLALKDSDVDEDDLEDLAEKYGITPGKAALVLRLKQGYPSLNVQDLAGMPITDLIRYCRASGIDISRYLGENGEMLGNLDDLDDLDDSDDLNDSDDKDDPDDSGDRDDSDDSDDRDDPDGPDNNDDSDDSDDRDDPDGPDNNDDPDDSDDRDDPDDSDDRDDPDDSDDNDNPDDSDNNDSPDGSDDRDDSNDSDNNDDNDA